MFTHLHVHTEYSLLDGHSRIPALVQRAKDQGMTALGITDHGGLYGAVDFYSACKDAGIKPIIGCELYLAAGSRHDRRPADKSPHHLTVLARNNTGYQNLMRLVTAANLEGFYYKPRVDKELLATYGDGLVVLSGCPSAELAQLLMQGDLAKAEELARWYQATFPHFYAELQRHTNLDFQEDLNSRLLDLAGKLDIPLVATNDLHYVDRDDAPYQDVMLCIQTNAKVHDTDRMRFSDDSYYLKSPEEMAEVFSDLPEAVEGTQRIAALCDISLDFSTLHLPEFPVPPGGDADSHLRALCWQGFDRRFGADALPENRKRLEYELEVITQTRYPNYFLVVWDIANFAREQDILLAVRGSAASSLALYCLGVTEIDPMEYGLVFERFLNVERKEMPDVDLDFQDDQRDKAIRYVVEKYGQDHVAQIITFGTLGAKAAIRDVGRALALPYTDVDRIARLVPTRLGITIDAAYEESAEMQEAYQGDETLRTLIDTARRLEGTVRHASTHAAGIVISKDPLTDHVPLQRPVKGEEQGAIMTQYSMGPLAKLGLLKMDFLGLSNLTILSMSRDLVRENQGVEIDIQAIPLDDPLTYELLGSGETTGLFQLESTGMRRYIKELRPTSLGDLAAMVALYRPGPMEHIGRFIESKHGREEPQFPHPALQEILQETYGIIVYQDQVLHILRTFAGYSLGSADIVRKAMGKKIPELMAQERERFVAGATGLGYEQQLAEEIFDLIEPFAGYAFNKAHSVSYAVVAYWTAYFKANYPVEFMTSVLNAYQGNADKVVAVAAECARLNIPVLPPDVNRSGVNFTMDTSPEGLSSIRFGLATVKNVGASAVSSLVEERVAGGPFDSLEEFCRRAGTAVANRRVLESLIRVGALDAFGPRGRLLATVDQLVGLIQRESQLKGSGQSTMFDLFGASVPTPLGEMQLREAVEPTATERALWERQLLGVPLSGATIQQLQHNAPDGAILSREELEGEKHNTPVTVVGPVSSVRLSATKEGRRCAFVMLELFTGSVEVAVWPEAYVATAALWLEGAIVQVTGKVRRRGEELSITCDEAKSYILPEPEEEPTEPPVEGPKMKEWPSPDGRQDPDSALATGQAPLASNLDGEPAVTAMGMGEAVTQATAQDEAQGPGAATSTELHAADPVKPYRNGDSPAVDIVTNGAIPALSSTPAEPQQLLINLTETDHPEDDTQLLRQVLSLLLEYPGTDSVDLVIFSQGTRYRMQMPIVKTSYCPELGHRLAELLGTQNAVTVQAPA